MPVLELPPLPFAYIRAKGMKGELGQTLLSTISQGKSSRTYHSPDDSQRAAASMAKPDMPLSLDLPRMALGFRVQGYGMSSWVDLFTQRQQASLETFAGFVSQVPGWVMSDGGSEDQARAITTALGLCIGKLAQASSCLVRWNARSSARAKAEPSFGRHDLSMSWDFAETNPFGGSVGDWMQIVETSSRAYSFIEPYGPASTVVQGDARKAGEGLDRNCLVLTDPPYFSAIGYANLSDYFYPWLRDGPSECLSGIVCDDGNP